MLALYLTMDFLGSSLLTPGKTPDFTRPLPRQIFYSPQPYGARGTTASEILAAFSPRPQPHTILKPLLSPPKPEITMNKRRDLRAKEKVTYTISDDSDGAEPLSGVDSSFSTPQNTQRARKIISLEDEDEDNEDDLQEIERPKTPPPRQSSAGHSLRQHQHLHLSLRAQENGDRPVGRKRKRSQRDSKQKKPHIVSDAPRGTIVVKTARNETRDFIATETARKRARFFVAKKEYFLPLLPGHNHIQKLAEQVEQSEECNETKLAVVPYQSIEIQPKG